MAFSARIARYDIAIILNTAVMSGMVLVTSNSRRGSPGSINWNIQHKTLHFRSFTISLASIFSSALSTYVVIPPCWAFSY